MAHISGNDGDTAQSPRYETPTFDSRSAFSWTLRAGEIAGVEARRQRSAQSGSPLLASSYLIANPYFVAK